ncbi:MAG TPA: outer membrane beta-barrel protein [Chitinophagaceae bacterium]|nr:outer membrane beta-barrel protein [Chitinophagaceae bacterium]
MNKQLVTRLLGLLAFLLPVQPALQAQMTWGPQAGINFSTLAIKSDDYQTRYRPGFYAGAYARSAISAVFSIQAELNYAAEGAGTRGTAGSNEKGHIIINQLQLPVLLQLNTPGGFYFEAGPQLNYLLSFRETWQGETADRRDQNKKTEFRIPAGIGYHFNRGLKGWSLRTRFSFSLSPLNKSAAIPGQEVRSLAGSIGLLYNLSQNK